MNSIYSILISLLLCLSSKGGIIQGVDFKAEFFVGTPRSTGISLNLTGLQNPIPNNGGIRLRFSQSFSLPSQILIIPVNGIGPVPTASISGKEVTILNGSPYSQATIVFGLYSNAGGILASTNNTGPLVVETITSSGTVIDSSSNVPITITLTALTAASITSLNDLTSTVSTLRIDLTTTNPLPPSTSVKVKMPVLNPYAPSQLQTNILTSLTSCINRTTEQSGSLNCQFQDGWLYITNAFPSGTNQSTRFVFDVQEIRNPQSLAPMSGFEIYLCKDNVDFFEQELNKMLVVSTPSPVQNFNLTSSTMVVYTLANIFFQVFPTGFVNPNSSVRLAFPDDLSLRGAIQIVPGRNMKQQIALEYTLNGQILSLDRAFENYFENDYFSFSIQNVRNPSYVTSSLLFTVSLIDNNGYLSNQGPVNISYQTLNGIYLLSVNRSNQIVSSISTYTLEITFDMPPTQGNMEVEFPPEISLQLVSNDSCTPVDGANVGAVCGRQGNKIILFDAFPITNPNCRIIFAVENALNPTSTGPISPFKVFTIRQNQVLQNFSLSFPLTTLSGEIVIDEVRFSDGTVDTDTSLLLTFTVESLVPIGSSFEFKLGTLNLERTSCQGFANIGFDVTCQKADNKVIINAAITEIKSQGTQFSIAFSNITTPRTTQPVCGITILIRDTSSVQVAVTQTGYCVSASKPAVLESKIQPLVSILSQQSSFNIELVIQDAIQEQDVLTIKIPDYLNFQSTSTQVRMLQPFQQLLPVQELNATEAHIIFPFRLARSEKIVLEISNIQNPLLTNPLLGFEFDISDSQGYALAKGINQNPILFESILDTSLTMILPSSTKVGAVGPYIITFPISFNLSDIGGIYIFFPSSFLILDESCAVTNIVGECRRLTRTSAYLTNFQSNSNPTDITVNIPSIQNSLNNIDDLGQLSFEIKDLTNRTIQLRQARFPFRLECEDGCSSCNTSASFCLGCSENYDLIQNSCIVQCQRGFGRSGITCRECQDSNCQVCTQAWNVCTECERGYQALRGKCIQQDKLLLYLVQDRNGVTSYFLVVLCLFVILSLIALSLWFKKHYYSFLEIILSLYSTLDLLGLAFLSYYASEFKDPREFIIIGLFWLADVGLQVYGAFALLPAIKELLANQNIQLSRFVPKLILIPSILLDIRILSYYPSIIRNFFINNREANNRNVPYKFFAIFSISSLKSFFIAIYCFAILKDNQTLPKDYLYLFLEYGAFSILLIILMMLLLLRLVKEIGSRRKFYRIFSKEKNATPEDQSQDMSCNIKSTPQPKAIGFINTAKTLAKDLDFTTLRRKFGKDFSEIKKLLTFNATKKGNPESIKRLRSAGNSYSPVPEYVNIFKVFSEDPNKRVQNKNLTLISEFDVDKEKESNEHDYENRYEEKEPKDDDILTLNNISPHVGRLADEEDFLRNSAKNFEAKLKQYNFS